MKNVKTLLILLSISTFIFASATRTDALGGAGFWADDYANIGAFPASVNNHNVAWTDGSDFTSVWNDDGTIWGFAGGSGHDVANIMWGNGSMGVTLGLSNQPEDTDAGTDADLGLNVGFGMPLAGMDFGVTYGMGGDNYGGGAVGVNLRRAQNLWLFENILVGFGMGIAGDDATAEPATMGLSVDLYKNTTYDSGINSLFGLGFNYGSVGDADPTMGIEWNFAVESEMTDWATLRLGYSHGYDFASGGTDANVVNFGDVTNPGTPCADGTMTCTDYVAPTYAGTADVVTEQAGGLVVGLGFNYGSFTLDMNVGGYENLFTNPGQYITGRNESLGANWTISYNW